jgi:hypothetical protein
MKCNHFCKRMQRRSVGQGIKKGSSVSGGAEQIQPPNRPKKLVWVTPRIRNRAMSANSTPMMMSI